MGSKTLADAIAYQKSNIKQMDERAKDIREMCKARNIDKYMRALRALVAAEPRADIYVGEWSVLIMIPVNSMKHMLEAIEAAEQVMGIEFDQTNDNAAGGERHFTPTKEWRLTIIGRIPLESSEGQGCQRVQTGVETVERPVYELVCTE